MKKIGDYLYTEIDGKRVGFLIIAETESQWFCGAYCPQRVNKATLTEVKGLPVPRVWYENPE